VINSAPQPAAPVQQPVYPPQFPPAQGGVVPGQGLIPNLLSSLNSIGSTLFG
jgi:hypothetical protein